MLIFSDIRMHATLRHDVSILTVEFYTLKWSAPPLLRDSRLLRPANDDISSSLLHFAGVVDDAKCILVTRVCLSVCLSAAAYPHYCTNPDVTLGTGVSPSCALLDGFEIGARVVLLWQHSANAKCQRVLVLALRLVIICISTILPYMVG